MSRSYAINYGTNLLNEWVIHQFDSKAERDRYMGENSRAFPVSAVEAKRIAQRTAIMFCHGEQEPPKSWSSNGNGAYWYKTLNRGEYDESPDESLYFRYLF